MGEIDTEGLRRLTREATPAEEWESHGVRGDTVRRLTPDSRICLNAFGAWAVGPDTKSLVQARKDAELIAAMRSALPAILDALDAKDREHEAAKKLVALHVRRDQMIANDTWESEGAYPLHKAIENAEANLAAALGASEEEGRGDG